MAGRGRQRTSFDKLQRERARKEKQAAKRARRQGTGEGEPATSTSDRPVNDPWGDPGSWVVPDALDEPGVTTPEANVDASSDAAATAAPAEPDVATG